VPEDACVPVFGAREVGEMSIVFEPRTGLWLMMYSVADEVKMLYSRLPWGPWTQVATANGDGVIFRASRDGTDPDSGKYAPIDHETPYAVERFIHEASYEDHLYEVNDDCGPSPDRYKAKDNGGPYAPYMIRPWFQTVGDRLTIFFTLSLWLPYQVVLMRADLDVVCNTGA
jgi:hypothetical protein